MSEEYIIDRERDLLDYIRNNSTDPESRGTDVVDETFTATAGQTEFILGNVLVKNVADLIKINGSQVRKGYRYFVTYGKGNETTKVTLTQPAALNDEIKISYHYGASFVEREYSRTDAKLPRIVMMFLVGSEEMAGLGDIMEDGRGSYFNVSFRFEIRDRYADRSKEIASKTFNLIRKLRHNNLFRTNVSEANDFQNFDYDPDKEAYILQFTAELQWEILFS